MNYEFIHRSEDPADNALSISQMQTFLRCRKQWEYSYVDSIMPRIDRPKMAIGKLIHAGFASAWKLKVSDPESTLPEWTNQGLMTIEKDFNSYMDSIVYLEEEIESFEEIRSTAKEVFLRSFHGFKPELWDPVILEDGTPLIELHFVVPCIAKRPLQGFIDLVARNKESGHVWQIDYKFVSSMGDPSDEMFNVQNPVYQYALRKIGVETVGSLTFHALNKPMTTPKVNKNGTISRAKINCDWSTYANFCISNGQNPIDYIEEMEEKLSDIEWYRFNWEYRNELTLRKVWKEVIVSTAYEITKRQKRYPRNISKMTCTGCQFQQLCHGDLRGYDTKFILQSEYKNKWEVEEETEEGV